jgi:hypothetical protein
MMSVTSGLILTFAFICSTVESECQNQKIHERGRPRVDARFHLKHEADRLIVRSPIMWSRIV